ncbi:MAG: hypothetical protein AMXMBFR33_13160 [Candidatus Xenobia bacterium]
MRNTLLILVALVAPALASPAERFLEAAEAGDLQTMSRIHVRVDCRDDEGETALMEAAEEGHLEVVRWLLEQGARPNLHDDEGETALIEAAEEGRRDVVALLLDWGAFINAHNHRGRTALMEAVTEGHTEVVALLLQRGAAVGLVDNRGRSAFDLAAGNQAMLDLLARRGGN